jgi:hypothetical protein
MQRMSLISRISVLTSGTYTDGVDLSVVLSATLADFLRGTLLKELLVSFDGYLPLTGRLADLSRLALVLFFISAYGEMALLLFDDRSGLYGFSLWLLFIRSFLTGTSLASFLGLDSRRGEPLCRLTRRLYSDSLKRSMQLRMNKSMFL